jgi:Tol biopolymer transport system component
MLKLPPRPYQFPRFAPDGKRVAVETDDGKEDVIWVIDDLMAASPPRRLTITGRNRFPIWNTDGERVAFQSDREGDFGIWWQRADGSGMAERLTKAKSGEAHIPNSWSPADRDTFIFSVQKDDKFSLWTYSLKSRKAAPFGGVVSSAMTDGNFSRDGRWIEYSTRPGSGPPRIFLQPFPSTGETYQISEGAWAAWSSDGKEMFIFNGFGGPTFKVVGIRTRPTVTTIGNPVSLELRGARAARAGSTVPRNWDISPVDNRVLGVVVDEELQKPQINVVLNWFEELKKRVPVQ